MLDEHGKLLFGFNFPLGKQVCVEKLNPFFFFISHFLS